MKNKESILSYNSSANTDWKIKEKYGEHIWLSPNSERQPDNFLLCNKKTPEDCSKELPFSEEWTDMVY